MMEEKRYCLNCNKELFGRVDKKFCDDYCRNGYHNYMKSNNSNLIRNINNALRKNRQILEELLDEKDFAKARMEKLLSNGFQFKYQTHKHTTKKGDEYIFCYDTGYLPLENDWYLIVRSKDNSENDK